MTAPAPAMSAECTVATATPDYETFHKKCRQTDDIHLPHSTGIILVARCTCACHRSTQ